MDINNQAQNSSEFFNQNVGILKKVLPKTSIVIFPIIFAFLIGGLGGYFLGITKNRDTDQPQQVQPTDKLEHTEAASTPVPIETLTPVSITDWETQTFEIEETTFAGKQTLRMEVKIPQNWKIQVNQKI